MAHNRVQAAAANQGDVKSGEPMESQPRVRFWFDPSCPYAWITSQWVSQIAQSRGFPVEWRLMSLAVLNDGKEVPDAYRQLMEQAWKPVRVITAAACEHGTSVIKQLYDALGDAIHRRRLQVDTAIVEALAECQLPACLAEVAETVDVDELIRSSHQEAQDLVGKEVGTPVIALDKRAFFGPVLTRVPSGLEAQKLWDATVTLAQYPHFFELQCHRDEQPVIPTPNG